MAEPVSITTGRRAGSVATTHGRPEEPVSPAPERLTGLVSIATGRSVAPVVAAAGLADGEARAQALDVERSWVVEAPAGSGKTGLLVQRFLKLLGSEEVSAPEQVLALTFTRKATEEMRERVLEELRGAAAGTPVRDAYERATRVLAEAVLQRDRAMGWRLLEDARRLRLRTIDALCGELAGSLPFLREGAALRPVEDAGPLHQEAARRTWRRLGDAADRPLDDALRTVLLHRDGNLLQCQSLLAEMLQSRDQWSELLPLDPEMLTAEALEGTVRARLDAALERVVCAGLSRLAETLPPGGADRLARFAAEMAELPLTEKAAGARIEHPYHSCREMTGAPEAVAAARAQWEAMLHLVVTAGGEWRAKHHKGVHRVEMGREQAQAAAELVASLGGDEAVTEAMRAVQRLPPTRYPDELWPMAKALFVTLRQALIDLQAVFQERGTCDFAETALLAERVLRERVPGPEKDARGELRHLLVDEVQDSSSRQFRLFALLTRGWTGRGRTVFLVGDPKQSIYLFRQARLEKFLETMRTGRLGDVELGVLHLLANFRSQAGLVAAFNRDFGSIFPSARVGHAARGEAVAERADVSHTEATAVRELAAGAAGDHGAVWHLSAKAEGAATGDGRRRWAAETARTVRAELEGWQRRCRAEGKATGRAAVLVRTRNELQGIVAELRREPAIPFRAVQIDPLKDRREVLDLLALLRALLDPADRIAWLAVLRAPACGLRLRDLHGLAGGDDARRQRRSVPELVQEGWPGMSEDAAARLARVWPILREAVEEAGRVRTPELVERTWRSLGYDRVLEGAERLNAAAFLRLLRGVDGEMGEVTLAEVLRRLETLYATPAPGESAVDLLTIYAAKGLEWDFVVLPELHRRTRVTGTRLLEWEELPDGDGVLLAPIHGKGEEATALGRWIRGLRAERERAERRRLFYVACTRAREELHLFGLAEERAGDVLAAEPGSLLEAAWPAVLERLNRRVLAMEAPAAGAEEGGVLTQLAAETDEEPGDELAGEERVKPVLLERIPLAAVGLTGAPGLVEGALEGEAGALEDGAVAPGSGAGAGARDRGRFERPTGSLAARATGRVAHLLLEQAAALLAQGQRPEELRGDRLHWEARASALLRTSGLPPREIRERAAEVREAIQRTLADRHGVWLLGRRAEARSEWAIRIANYGSTSYGSATDGSASEGMASEGRQVRMDRVFRGGARPIEDGADVLWIVDYKLAVPHGRETEDEFLRREAELYRSQMETYARAVPEEGEVRLGLWFARVSRMAWWASSAAESGGEGGLAEAWRPALTERLPVRMDAEAGVQMALENLV